MSFDSHTLEVCFLCGRAFRVSHPPLLLCGNCDPYGAVLGAFVPSEVAVLQAAHRLGGLIAAYDLLRAWGRLDPPVAYLAINFAHPGGT